MCLAGVCVCVCHALPLSVSPSFISYFPPCAQKTAPRPTQAPQNTLSPTESAGLEILCRFSYGSGVHKITDIVKNKSNSKIQDSVNKFLNSNYYKDDIYKVINKLAPDDDKYKSLDNFVINDIKNYTRKDVITLLDLNNIKYDKENNKKELVKNIVNYINENPNKIITGYEDEKLKYKNIKNYEAYDNMKIKNNEIMNKNSNYKNIGKSK